MEPFSGALLVTARLVSLTIELDAVPEEVRRCLELVRTCHNDVQHLIATRNENIAVLESRPRDLSRVNEIIEAALRGLTDVAAIVEKCRPEVNGGKTNLLKRFWWTCVDKESFKSQVPVVERHHIAVVAELSYVRQLGWSAPGAGGGPKKGNDDKSMDRQRNEKKYRDEFENLGLLDDLMGGAGRFTGPTVSAQTIQTQVAGTMPMRSRTPSTLDKSIFTLPPAYSTPAGLGANSYFPDMAGKLSQMDIRGSTPAPDGKRATSLDAVPTTTTNTSLFRSYTAPSHPGIDEDGLAALLSDSPVAIMNTTTNVQQTHFHAPINITVHIHNSPGQNQAEGSVLTTTTTEIDVGGTSVTQQDSTFDFLQSSLSQVLPQGVLSDHVRPTSVALSSGLEPSLSVVNDSEYRHTMSKDHQRPSSDAKSHERPSSRLPTLGDTKTQPQRPSSPLQNPNSGWGAQQPHRHPPFNGTTNSLFPKHTGTSTGSHQDPTSAYRPHAGHGGILPQNTGTGALSQMESLNTGSWNTRPYTPSILSQRPETASPYIPSITQHSATSSSILNPQSAASTALFTTIPAGMIYTSPQLFDHSSQSAPHSSGTFASPAPNPTTKTPDMQPRRMPAYDALPSQSYRHSVDIIPSMPMMAELPAMPSRDEEPAELPGWEGEAPVVGRPVDQGRAGYRFSHP